VLGLGVSTYYDWSGDKCRPRLLGMNDDYVTFDGEQGVPMGVWGLCGGWGAIGRGMPGMREGGGRVCEGAGLGGFNLLLLVGRHTQAPAVGHER
jgi:hypothetical protein